jgi:hypothetical protein
MEMWLPRAVFWNGIKVWAEKCISYIIAVEM